MYAMSQCRKFAPNIFNKSKCSNCFRQKEEHSAEALESNRASRKVARSGYLFVAPDWDFSVPLNRTKRWQRRWFVLYDDGELNYSVDEHPDTIPQGSVDMCKVLEVTGAEQVTGHPHSLALTSPDRVTFIKAATREEARWWAELLAVFPRRHKRNATFPGGRASPSLPQLGRSASPQPPRPRHLSCTGPSPRTNFITPPLKEERESPTKEETPRPVWVPEPTMPIETPSRTEYVLSSGSPPTRDKLRSEEKTRARRDWRNERLRDIATALTDRSPESSLALPAESLLHMKKGWLWSKESDDDWTKRWWVLSAPTLCGYRDQDERGTPDVAVELGTVTAFNEIPCENRYGFQVRWLGPPLILSAVTAGIRTNWLQTLKKALPDLPEQPMTPRSVLLSSDEEYRTASEGGRRGSEDWGELPPSPPLSRTPLTKVKEKARARPRLPRSQSRQSTIDSVSTDELETGRGDAATVEIELRRTLGKQSAEIEGLKQQLLDASGEVRALQDELSRAKKAQSDTLVRERETERLLSNLETIERELKQKMKQTDDQHSREQRGLEMRLGEAERAAQASEERCDVLARELQNKQRVLASLQEELDCANERLARDRHENDRLYKRLQEFESANHRIDSLTDLTNVEFDGDPNGMSRDDLVEQCLDLKSRFDKAVIEVRAMKRELRESHVKCDGVELENFNLQKSLQMAREEAKAHSVFMATRVQDLTNKLMAAERQVRSLKAKLQDSREKRRSLSLKGRDSFSIGKEVEDKIVELETKVQSIEKGRARRRYRRERSSERASPIDDRSLRRLRRKSLDSAATSEPMKLLIRLSALDSKIASIGSTESLNVLTASASESKLEELVATTDHLDRVKDVLKKCVYQVSSLKNSKNKRSSSVEKLNSLEVNLCEIDDILNGGGCLSPEIDAINSAASSMATQFQSLLTEKLTDLADRKRLLRENDKFDDRAAVQILAEKFAYENVLVSRIRQALDETTSAGEVACDRLESKEILETAHLISSLRDKLTGKVAKQPPALKTSADYLTKILAKRLIKSAECGGALSAKPSPRRRFNKGPLLNRLKEKQTRIDAAFNIYKTNKLPQLADALAAETMNLASDSTCRLRTLDTTTSSETYRMARESVNSELIRSEIGHVLMRTAQIYETDNGSDDTFFFSFFASERAALELWSDSVEDRLRSEMEKNIRELTEMYQNSLNKLQRQNWRRRVESERNAVLANNLLYEFADIVAHKALIDSRIRVLDGEYKKKGGHNAVAAVGSAQENFIADLIETDKLWCNLEDAGLVQINQSLEAEFKYALNKFSDELCDVSADNLEYVRAAFRDLTAEITKLRRCVGYVQHVASDEETDVKNFRDVCSECRKLHEKLKLLRDSLEKLDVIIAPPHNKFETGDERRPSYLGAEYLTHVENLRAAYRSTLLECKNRTQQTNIEQLQVLCERVLLSMEHWHRRTLQDMRSAHTHELQALRQDKEQALAEETQATLAALDAMRKAHEAEVQREVARFKQDFARQQENKILELSEQLSVKCLETAALEDQLGSATRQLAHAQKHILQLERNPQLSSL